MELITIKESHHTNDLLILKSKLESEGIPSFIKDELTSEILTHIPSMSGKLQVYSKDIQKVKEILKKKLDIDEHQPKIICSRCGSNSYKVKVGLSTSNKLNLFLAMIKALNIFSSTSSKNQPIVYTCKNCNYDFCK